MGGQGGLLKSLASIDDCNFLFKKKQFGGNILKWEPANGFQNPPLPSHPSHKLKWCLQTHFQPIFLKKWTKAKPKTTLSPHGRKNGRVMGASQNTLTCVILTIKSNTHYEFELLVKTSTKNWTQCSKYIFFIFMLKIEWFFSFSLLSSFFFCLHNR